jgi:poly(3-hydroxybutyrate) depolymerase
MITVIPAGFERYRYNGPPYNECDPAKYAAEFNYLSNCIGRTRHSNANDIRFLSKIINWLNLGGGTTNLIDLSQIYVTGHASGGHMAFFMMTEYMYGSLTDSIEFPIAGGAASASSFLTCLTDPRYSHGDNGNWIGLGPRPFMYFQGLQDLTGWCGGGGEGKRRGEHMYTTEQMAFALAERNKCGTTPEGYFRINKVLLTNSIDSSLPQNVELWEFSNCESPLIIYTIPGMDHLITPEMNTWMFKQKFKFFLNDWTSPGGGITTVLNTKNGTQMCGCCNENTGACDRTSRCNSQQYLQSVSCPAIDEIDKKCWTSTDLTEGPPVCWWTQNDLEGSVPE